MLKRWNDEAWGPSWFGTSHNVDTSEQGAVTISRWFQLYPDVSSVQDFCRAEAEQAYSLHISYLSYLRLNRVLQKLEGRLHEPPAGTWRHPILLSANVQHVQCAKWAITACILSSGDMTWEWLQYTIQYYNVDCSNRLWPPRNSQFPRWSMPFTVINWLVANSRSSWIHAGKLTIHAFSRANVMSSMSSEQQLFASFHPETWNLKDHNDGPCISRSCQYLSIKAIRGNLIFPRGHVAFVSLSVDAANEPARSVERLVKQSDKTGDSRLRSQILSCFLGTKSIVISSEISLTTRSMAWEKWMRKKLKSGSFSAWWVTWMISCWCRSWDWLTLWKPQRNRFGGT